jgi:hypothetical protein
MGSEDVLDCSSSKKMINVSIDLIKDNGSVDHDISGTEE